MEIEEVLIRYTEIQAQEQALKEEKTLQQEGQDGKCQTHGPGHMVVSGPVEEASCRHRSQAPANQALAAVVHKASHLPFARTTEVSTCRGGMSQNLFSRRVFASAGMSAYPSFR